MLTKTTIWFTLMLKLHVDLVLEAEDFMKSSDMIRQLCKKKQVTVAELARRLNQTPQNLGKKLNRDTVTLDEMMDIARALGVTYEQAFVLNDGEKIEISGPGPIYFTKVEFREVIGYGNTSSIMLLNIPEQELSYQVFNWKRQMPALEGVKTEEFYGHEWTERIALPAVKMRNGKTNFKAEMLVDDLYEQEVVFSHAINITDEQMEELLPYCDATVFEPYRDKEMSMDDVGFIGYRDEVHLYFKAVTDSFIPLLELPMDYYYDEEHIWPSERLYRYLVKNFFEGNKKLKGRGPAYGGLSLFF